MIFETRNLILRRITEKDLEDFYYIMGNDNTMKYLGKTLTKEEVGYYINSISKKKFADNEGEFAIVLKETNKVIGQFSINIKKKDSRVEISYMLNDNYWHKGYGYECSKYILDYLFNELNMNKVIADTDVSNVASLKLLEKLGMEQEGILKKHRFNRKTNLYYDVAIYGILNKNR